MPNFFHSTVTWPKRAAERDRHLAAGEEPRLLPGERDERRLGEHLREAVLLEQASITLNGNGDVAPKKSWNAPASGWTGKSGGLVGAAGARDPELVREEELAQHVLRADLPAHRRAVFDWPNRFAPIARRPPRETSANRTSSCT